MVIFILCLIALSLAYKFYSPFVAKQACIDPEAQTPSSKFEDGVDYVPVKPAKAFSPRIVRWEVSSRASVV